jgi:hypothetical protein
MLGLLLPIHRNRKSVDGEAYGLENVARVYHRDRRSGIAAVVLPSRIPDLNVYAERWVRSVKEECLSRLILFGEALLRRALHEEVDHYHRERPIRERGLCP